MDCCYKVSESEIISNARDAAKLSCSDISGCVYFLILDSKIIYVGQTTNAMTRLKAHKYGEHKKEFDSFYCLPVDDVTYLRYIEAYYIDTLKPELNAAEPSPQMLQWPTPSVEDEPETLMDYIANKHQGKQAAFGRAQGVLPQQVTKWLDMGCIVVDGKLYSPRRDVKE